MAETVHRTCDWVTGRSKQPCGKRVPNDLSTEFTIEDVTYSMDVCREHKNAWLEANGMALDIAVPVSSKRATSAVRAVMKGNRTAFTTKDVRDWLRAQGEDVPDSGRLPNEAIEAYKQAH